MTRARRNSGVGGGGGARSYHARWPICVARPRCTQARWTSGVHALGEPAGGGGASCGFALRRSTTPAAAFASASSSRRATHCRLGAYAESVPLRRKAERAGLSAECGRSREGAGLSAE